MPTLSKLDALSLLYQAKASKYGIVIRVSNFVQCKQTLYTAKRESQDEALKTLIFRPSPFDPENEMWIVRSDGQIPSDVMKKLQDEGKV